MTPWLMKGRKDRGSENSKIDLAKTYAMRRKMCVVSSMSVLSVSSGMAGEPIRRPWARCISINDDDRAQWIDNDEGGVVGIKANGEYTHVRLLSNSHRPSNARADAVAVDDLPVTLVRATRRGTTMKGKIVEPSR